MTTVSINFTQATLDALTAYRATTTGAAPAPTLARQFDQVIQAGYNFSASHYYYDGIALEAPSGWLTFSDGAYQHFSGMELDTAAGSITATTLDDYVPGAYALTYEGQLKFGYSSTAGKDLVLVNQGGTVTRITLKSQLAFDDPAYNSVLGNTSTTLHGTITSSDASRFSGVVTSLEGSADNLLASSKWSGTFNVSGNATDIGLGTSSVSLNGTLTSLVQTYTDGSTFTINGPLAVTGATAFDDRILSNSTYFTGNDTISVTLPANLTTAYAVNGGNGDDRITITGGGRLLTTTGGNGNDTIVLGDHGHAVSGGAGLDSAIFSGQRAAYAVSASATTTGDATITASGGAADTLTGIERIQFDNAYVALDIGGNAGQAYRLYQAAYNRTPDLAGLGYWIKQMDNGLSLLDMAKNFTHAPEFIALYGATPSNGDLVNSFYRNALHREAEPAGYAYWLDVLDRKLVAAVDLLVMFSEGAENQAAVLPVVTNGINYTPYGG